MKCKINGFWNSNGTGQNDKGESFSWNNFMFSVTYTDKKQSHMIGKKSTSLKIKAAELNVLLGLGLTPDGVLNCSAEWLENEKHLLGATIMVDYDDDKNLIDLEVLSTIPQNNKVSESSSGGQNFKNN